MNELIYGIYDSKLGSIYIVCTNEQIIGVQIGEEDFKASKKADALIRDEDHPLVQEALKQLDEYFLGLRKEFDLPLHKKGTVFQQAVWDYLLDIPFGQTRSYQDVAVAIGNEKAVRAIGQANKANQLPIIIPCHRVIGKNQSLTGYAGTRTDIKEVLLSLEGASYKK